MDLVGSLCHQAVERCRIMTTECTSEMHQGKQCSVMDAAFHLLLHIEAHGSLSTFAGFLFHIDTSSLLTGR
ncbi:hypothetical protein EYF80_047360 [Liparis tanakae]|uniref:Uncharacterized protein n=1 Tax=Liparis tanakae TaxID=230148 RepID=A0A4Z2FNU8_9TELE|nr:hypothetical protein EYF80_047360 [Liparis tanakae]